MRACAAFLNFEERDPEETDADCSDADDGGGEEEEGEEEEEYVVYGEDFGGDDEDVVDGLEDVDVAEDAVGVVSLGM